MTPANQPDPLNGYADNDRDAVYAARPAEPTDAAWDAVRRRIHARLNPPAPARGNGRWHAAVLVATGAALTATAAAVAWGAFGFTWEKPEVARGIAVPPVQVAPAPHEAVADPLAGFVVLPMATADEVDLRRVPGSGWLPVGTDPLPGTVTLAAHSEIELDDPDSTWPQVTPSPGDAPMIYAAKPR